MTNNNNNNLIIDLKRRTDKDSAFFYVGKLQFPGTLDFSAGVTFLVFISDNGEEQIQIAPMNKNNKERDNG